LARYEHLPIYKAALENRLYSPSRSVCFFVRKPKPREVFAADFRDRVVHHVLVEHLEKISEPPFIHDSYACRRVVGNMDERLAGFERELVKEGSLATRYSHEREGDTAPAYSAPRLSVRGPTVCALLPRVSWGCGAD
jgi:hypothetical protein